MATSFSIVPLRVTSFLGLTIASLGFMSALLIVIWRLIGNSWPEGWALIVVTILVIGGVQLIALGMLGEYLGRVLITINLTPQYVIEKLIGKTKKLSCDLLCVSGGWTPTVHLFSQSRGKLIYRESDATFIPGKSFQNEISKRHRTINHTRRPSCNARHLSRLQKILTGQSRHFAPVVRTPPWPWWIFTTFCGSKLTVSWKASITINRSVCCDSNVK